MLKALCTITGVTYGERGYEQFSYFHLPGTHLALEIPIFVDVPKGTVGTLYYTGVCWVFVPKDEENDDVA